MVLAFVCKNKGTEQQDVILMKEKEMFIFQYRVNLKPQLVKNFDNEKEAYDAFDLVNEGNDGKG